ncbi:cytochrome c oxidase accessory protein CcoG [Azospirillum thermophilum]|uniref:cytochrome c oxidase accessory protein CcoG n=1 Tax=Azospirillum thermophilum TaxID=2202148 RepID=UPI001FECF29C|nr:cytochrome c oxidase accessory protein CcoG [Azospirillum thermophilum]
MAQAAPPAYAPHRKIHPKAVRGRYRRIKTATGTVLLALFALLPWLRWDRGPDAPGQAVLLDLGNQRFYLFAVELWPQQIYYVTGAMILAAVGLFLATALAGRVWCGYSCPQTVWTDLYIWIERLVEGDRGDRIRLDRHPWTAGWIARKLVKHAGWLLVALATGAIGVFYFTDAPALVADLLRFQAPAPAVWSILFFAACTYAMAGFMREQMCIYVCPWPRIQAAMLDEESLVVTYQDWRGEGRAPVRKSQGWDERAADGLGDCIDCGACVQVCPTGIDIRDGIQMECISCGLCIDACNDVMARIGRPGDLIRYDTQAAQAAKATGRPAAPYRWIRPRTIVYTLLIVVVAGLMGIGLALKPRSDISVLRDRAPLFVQLADGRIQNAYTVKIANMTLAGTRYRLTLSGPAGATLGLAGTAGEADRLSLSAHANAVDSYRVYVRVPPSSLAATSTPLAFHLVPEDGSGDQDVRRDTVFLAP